MPNKIDQILIIDDNSALHDSIKAAFDTPDSGASLSDLEDGLFGPEDTDETDENFNLEFTSAFQGEEGFNFYKEAFEKDEPFKVVICDMRMPPGWNGFQTIKAIGELDKNAIIFFVYRFFRL